MINSVVVEVSNLLIHEMYKALKLESKY